MGVGGVSGKLWVSRQCRKRDVLGGGVGWGGDVEGCWMYEKVSVVMSRRETLCRPLRLGPGLRSQHLLLAAILGHGFHLTTIFRQTTAKQLVLHPQNHVLMLQKNNIKSI